MKLFPLSIILPTYNRLFILKDILPKYLVLPVSEVVVVNDASQDGTKEYLDDLVDEKLKVVHHVQRKCLPSARNSGIKASTQPYILMGEDDVIMDDDYVSALLQAMNKLNADIIAGRLIPMKKDETTIEADMRIRNNPSETFIFSDRLSCDFSIFPKVAIETPLIHACSLFKKEWALKYPYCEEYKGNALREESNFYFNCFKNGAKIFFTPEATAFHMYHDYAGGCRGNQLLYLYSSIVNNHRFLNNFWVDIKKATGTKANRFTMEFRLMINSVKNAIAHSMRHRAPQLHAWLKKLSGNGEY